MTSHPVEPNESNPKSALLLSRLQHANALLKAQLRRMEAEAAHRDAIMDQRLVQLEGRLNDHETRLRAATEGVTQFKLFSGLASGGSGIMSLVAIIKAFLGG